MTPKFHSGNCRFRSNCFRLTMQTLTARCLSWSVASMRMWACSGQHLGEGIGFLVRTCLVFCVSEKSGDMTPKFHSGRKKVMSHSSWAHVTGRNARPCNTHQKKQLFCDCLLGAKRGARLPRPPLDPPSVGPAASGSECPSNK